MCVSFFSAESANSMSRCEFPIFYCERPLMSRLYYYPGGEFDTFYCVFPGFFLYRTYNIYSTVHQMQIPSCEMPGL